MLRLTTCLCLIGIALQARPLISEEQQPEAFLETLPAVARVSLTIRNLEELDTHYVQHLKKQNNFSPRQLVGMGLSYLKIQLGVDWDGTFALMVMDWGEGPIHEDKLNYMVLRIPYDNALQMGQNFGLFKPEEVVPGKIHLLGKRLNSKEDLYVTFRENYVLVGMREDAIQQYLDATPMKTVVTTDPGGRVSGSDVLLQMNPRALQPDKYNQQVDRWIEEMFQGESGELRERARQVVQHTEQVLISMKIDSGVHVRVHCSLSSALPAEIQTVLKKYAKPSTVPDLRGLPRGNMLLSLSKAADREQNESIQNRSIGWLLEQTTHNKAIVGLVRPYLDPRSETFHGLIDEIWNSIVTARSAVYQNENIDAEGLANLLIILRPEQPEEFTQQLASLVKFSRGAVYNPRTQTADKVTDQEIRELIEQLGAQEFMKRKAATLRLKLLGEVALPYLEKSVESTDREVVQRSKSLLSKIRESAAHHAEILIKEGLSDLPMPEFVFYENQRKVEGFPTDVLVAQWSADDLASAKRVQELAGPLGHEILIVHVDDEIVLFWGSDRSLLDKSVQLLKSGEPGLNEQRELFARYASPQRLMETHISLQKFAKMVPGSLGRKVPDYVPTDDFSSFGIEISPRHLIGDASFPLPEFELIARYFFLF